MKLYLLTIIAVFSIDSYSQSGLTSISDGYDEDGEFVMYYTYNSEKDIQFLKVYNSFCLCGGGSPAISKYVVHNKEKFLARDFGYGLFTPENIDGSKSNIKMTSEKGIELKNIHITEGTTFVMKAVEEEPIFEASNIQAHLDNNINIYSLNGGLKVDFENVRSDQLYVLHVYKTNGDLLMHNRLHIPYDRLFHTEEYNTHLLGNYSGIVIVNLAFSGLTISKQLIL